MRYMYRVFLHRYVGLFPLLLRMLPADSAQLSAMLAQLRDPDHLWTDAGLRSLSRSIPQSVSRGLYLGLNTRVFGLTLQLVE